MTHATLRKGQLLSLCLFLTGVIAFQNHLYLGKVSWFLAALLCAARADMAIYMAFFFGAFFYQSGFFPELFFTLKHFHIAIGLLIVIETMRSSLLRKIKARIQTHLIFLIWFAILLIAAASSFSGKETLSGLRTSANIFSVIVGVIILVSAVGTRKAVFGKAVLFYLLGVSLRLLLAVLTYLGAEAAFVSERLLYNNHLGFVICSSVFLLLPLMMAEKIPWRKVVLSCLFVFFLCGLLMSGSRTGWFSFLIAYVFFSIFCFRAGRSFLNFRDTRKHFNTLTIILLTFFTIFIAAFFTKGLFGERIRTLKRLLIPEYWSYTIHDVKNFGFLGFQRLTQFGELSKILKIHPVWGVGLIHSITDFHSLFLTILGGTGFVGLFLFLFFLFFWARKLVVPHLYHDKDGLYLYRVGALCACLVWFLYSFMESFVVQFHIWIMLAVGCILHETLTAPSAPQARKQNKIT